MRYPYAAEQMIAEAQEADSKIEVEPVGDPDGLDVQRSFRFDKDSSADVKAALEVVADPRIESVENTAHGLVVTFVPNAPADTRDEFGLGQVLRAVTERRKAEEAEAAEKAKAERASKRSEKSQ